MDNELQELIPSLLKAILIKLAEQRASSAEQRARILEEQLRALGVDPETLG